MNVKMRAAIIAVVVAILVAVPTVAEEAVVAVAANFAEPMEQLRAEFEKTSEHRIRVSTASTGKLYAQIRSGAPFDVLMAADQERPARVESDELAVPGTRFTYAVGRLTLWSPDLDRIGPDGVTALKEDFRKLAIANPKLAPYGRAAQQVLLRLGLLDRVSDRLVVGENIGQTMAFVITGGADLGFVALSHVVSLRNRAPGSRWDVPEDLHDPIRQDAVLLKRASHNPAARAFLDFLRSDQARAMIEGFGYGLE